MGQMTGNYQSTVHAVGDILLGDNEFESGALTVAANGSVTEGALLKRDSNGKFVAVSDLSNETPVAVFVGETLTNATASAKDFEIRAVISGRVDATKCHVGSDALTAAGKDMLRNYSIIALDVVK